MTRALTQPSEYDPLTPPIFETTADVPEMDWKVQPTQGHVGGSVRDRDAEPFDQVSVELFEGWHRVSTAQTDGAGWFGFVDLPPGYYWMRASGGEIAGFTLGVVRVTTGHVAEVTLRARRRN